MRHSGVAPTSEVVPFSVLTLFVLSDKCSLGHPPFYSDSPFAVGYVDLWAFLLSSEHFAYCIPHQSEPASNRG